MAVLFDHGLLRRSDIKLLEDLSSVEYVKIAAVAVFTSHERRTSPTKFRPNLISLYRMVDRLANHKVSNDDLTDDNLIARLVGTAAIVKASSVNQLSSELTARELDVILCPRPFQDVYRYAACSSCGIWWLGPTASLLPEKNYREHFFVTANGLTPFVEKLWVLTPSQSKPFVLDFVSTPRVSGISVEKNVGPLEESRSNLFLAILRKLYLFGWESLISKVQSTAQNLPPEPLEQLPAAQALVHMGIRQVQHRVRQRNRAELWRVGVRPMRNEVSALCNTQGYQWLNTPSGYWYADPFVFSFAGRELLFMEEFDRSRKQGHIVCGEVDSSGRVSNVQPVLKRPYHLAYPHVFEHDGEVFMIPDSGFNNTVELFRASSFPSQWELVRTLYFGAAFDTSAFEYGGRFWFLTSLVRDVGRHAAQLLLFSSKSLESDWVLHPDSPISSDARFSRCGGRVFRLGSQILRPAQDGSRTYGGAIHFRSIQTINEYEYVETAYASVTPEHLPNAVGLHTYNRSVSMEAIDCRESRDVRERNDD